MAYKRLLLREHGGISPYIHRMQQTDRPSLLIGLGGIGITILRHIKKEVYSQIQPHNHQYSRISFLGIDTDQNEIGQTNVIYEDELQAEEFLSLAVYFDGIHKFPDWMSNEIKFYPGDTTNGSGAIRQIGRYCFTMHVEQLYTVLREKICRMDFGGIEKTIDIYFFAGLSGGTGSGCLLDICYLMRSILSEQGFVDNRISGYCVLPDVQCFHIGVSQAQRKRMMANAYAALREINHFMNISAAGGFFQETYSPNIHVVSDEPPMDFCYLISQKTSDGHLSADYHFTIDRIVNYVLYHLMKHKEALPIDSINPGRRSRYYAIGVASDVIPIRSIYNYLAASFFKILEPSPEKKSSETMVQEFAEKIGLSTAKLLEKLSEGCETDIIPDDGIRIPMAPEQIETPLFQYKKKLLQNAESMTRRMKEYNMDCPAAMNQKLTYEESAFVELMNITLDSSKGPMAAADILHSYMHPDLNYVLDTMLCKLSNYHNQLQNQCSLIKNAVDKAYHDCNSCGSLFKRRIIRDYNIMLQEYYQAFCKMLTVEEAIKQVHYLQYSFQKMYREYFEPLVRIVEEICDTFRDNRNILSSYETNPIPAALMDYFNHHILNSLNTALEYTNFMKMLIAYCSSPQNENEGYLVTQINDYILQKFSGINTYVENYFQPTDENQIYNGLRSLLHYSHVQYSQNGREINEIKTLVIPSSSQKLRTAALNISHAAPNVLYEDWAKNDGNWCFVTGVDIQPKYYYLLSEMKKAYEADTMHGLHLHEQDNNWKETLSDIC